MTLNIGVIGTGSIGTYHARRLATLISGATVTALFDVATDRVRALAGEVGATVHTQATDVVEDPAVDAVVISSPGDLHADQVLACIEAGKPVLCEKPLAPTSEDCLKVIDAEVESGRRLVQVGFMRRFDPAHLQVKAALAGGDIGEALLLHCIHRNPTAAAGNTRQMALTDSVVHEIDTTRWLLAEEIVAVSFRAGRRSPHAAAQDPQMVIFETASGVLVDVESFVNCRYGYDVRCELVGSEGSASVDNPSLSTVTRRGTRSNVVPADWGVRFDVAFHAEIQDWVSSVQSGECQGASAWDGYAATAVAEAGLAALASGERTGVQMVDQPLFYSSPHASSEVTGGSRL